MKHSEAAQVIARNFAKVAGRAPTQSEAGYCQAVAWLETFYGRGGQFAKFFAQGMVNWGALETVKPAGGCPPGLVSGSDVGTVCFYTFDSDDAACETFLRVLLTGSRSPGQPVRPAIAAAMQGAPGDVAQAMSDAGYFSAPVDQYANAIATSLQVNAGPGGITDQGVPFKTPEPPAGTPPQTPATPGAKPGGTGFFSSTTAKVVAGVLAVAGVGLLAVRYYRR